MVFLGVFSFMSLGLGKTTPLLQKTRPAQHENYLGLDYVGLSRSYSVVIEKLHIIYLSSTTTSHKGYSGNRKNTSQRSKSQL